MAKKVSFDQLPSVAQRALFDNGSAVDQETLLKELVDAFGGPREIARTVAKEFQDAPPGGITRQRILEMLTRLVTQVSDSAQLTMKRPSDMTDDELKDQAIRYLEMAVQAKDEGGPWAPEGSGKDAEAEAGGIQEANAQPVPVGDGEAG